MPLLLDLVPRCLRVRASRAPGLPSLRARRSAGARPWLLAGLVTLLLASGGRTEPTPFDPAAAYPDPRAQLVALAELADRHPGLVRVAPLPGTETLRPAPVLITLALEGETEPTARPSVLVVGGLDAGHLVGIEAAHRLVAVVAERAAGAEPLDPDLAARLRTTTLLVVPCLDMEGWKGLLAAPRAAEAVIAAESHDDDRDGLRDEDPGDDVDADGMVTQMRVADPAGPWREDAADPRILYRARAGRGEAGGWHLEVEGRDHDGDGRWNEDGSAGSVLARHWPLGRAWDDSRGGAYPLRRPEAKALADLLVARENIVVVLAFGPDDTLARPTKGRAFEASVGEPMGDWDEADAAHLGAVAAAWRRAIGLDGKADVTLGAPTSGTLAEFAYMARGRLAFSTGVWSPSLQLVLEGAAKSAQAAVPEEAASPGAGAEGDGAAAAPGAATPAPDGAATEPAPAQPVDPSTDTPAAPADADVPEEVLQRRKVPAWFDRAMPGAARPWREVAGIDRDGRRVEVGGLAPFAETAPPPALVDDLLTSHALFVAGLLDRLPRVELASSSVREAAPGVFEVKLVVRNAGMLPTLLAHGVRSEVVRPTWVEFELPEEAIVAGRRRTRLEPLAGGAAAEVRVVVALASGSQLPVTIRSAQGGTARTLLQLGAPAGAPPDPAGAGTEPGGER